MCVCYLHIVRVLEEANPRHLAGASVCLSVRAHANVWCVCARVCIV